MDKLKEILEHKRKEVSGMLAPDVSDAPQPRPFRSALQEREGIALIAEVKKASPSKGVIVPDFDPVRIANAYVLGGAACLSVLTERAYFQGSPEDLVAVREAVSVPLLRKDFIVCREQVAESRAIGADCVLLIAAALSEDELRDFQHYAWDLGMDALVEVHDESEMAIAARVGSKLIGINNRDLSTFEVDLSTTQRLASHAPKDALLVSESGIWTRDDVLFVENCGAKAILVGESLERQEDIAEAVSLLIHS